MAICDCVDVLCGLVGGQAALWYSWKVDVRFGAGIERADIDVRRRHRYGLTMPEIAGHIDGSTGHLIRWLVCVNVLLLFKVL